MQQQAMKKEWPRWTRLVLFAALALVVGFVFSNSMKVAVQSSQVSGSMLDDLYLAVPSLRGWLTEHLLRKIAHFAEYSLTGFLLMLCLRSCTPQIRQNWAKPALGGVLIALTDETIQLFVEGRSGQISDVWLDSAGVCFGLVVMWCMLVFFAWVQARRYRNTGGNV